MKQLNHKTEEIRKHVRRNPFRPILLRLTNGESYEVADGNAIHCNDQGTLVSMFVQDGTSVLIFADELVSITQPPAKGGKQ